MDADDSLYKMSSQLCITRNSRLSTLQFLHFQTKLASPLLPLISLVSYQPWLALSST